MSRLLELFVNNLLPILLIALGGFALGRFLGVKPDSLSKTAFYLLSPALLFSLVSSSEVDVSSAVRMALTVILLMASLSLITLVAARLLKLERNLQLAVLLAVIFMNAGNFGLSLNHFALGEEAVTFSGIFFAVQVILVNSVGVLIASSGSRSWRDAFIGLLKVPGLYALALALIFRFSALAPPLPVQRSVDLLAQAAIPVMILLMGVQLSHIQWGGVSRPMILATGMRLVVSPLLALVIGGLLGLQGPARQATILEAATPTAVIAIVLGTEFDLEPIFLTSVVLITTILSPFTITPILALIGA